MTCLAVLRGYYYVNTEPKCFLKQHFGFDLLTFYLILSSTIYKLIVYFVHSYDNVLLQGREMDTRCTIYKKTDEVYQLKLKASRMFYSEVSNHTSNTKWKAQNTFCGTVDYSFIFDILGRIQQYV